MLPSRRLKLLGLADQNDTIEDVDNYAIDRTMSRKKRN